MMEWVLVILDTILLLAIMVLVSVLWVVSVVFDNINKTLRRWL